MKGGGGPVGDIEREKVGSPSETSKLLHVDNDMDNMEEEEEAWSELLGKMKEEPGFFAIVFLVAFVMGFMGISVAAVSHIYIECVYPSSMSCRSSSSSRMSTTSHPLTPPM